MDSVLETVRDRQLWVADRNFCTLKFLYGLAAAGAKFIIRQHSQVKGRPLGKPRRIGKTEAGVVLEQKFELPDYQGKSLIVRRVIVNLKEPTRDGDYEFRLLTNLPREDADALEIAEEYRKRWRIETVMQVLTEAFRCEIKPLCYPKAALFGFAIALVMYSSFPSVLIAIPPARWIQAWRRQHCRAAGAEMVRIAADADLHSRYAKSTRGPKKPKTKPTHAKRNVHVSTKKLLDERRLCTGMLKGLVARLPWHLPLSGTGRFCGNPANWLAATRRYSVAEREQAQPLPLKSHSLGSAAIGGAISTSAC